MMPALPLRGGTIRRVAGCALMAATVSTVMLAAARPAQAVCWSSKTLKFEMFNFLRVSSRALVVHHGVVYFSPGNKPETIESKFCTSIDERSQDAVYDVFYVPLSTDRPIFCKWRVDVRFTRASSAGPSYWNCFKAYPTTENNSACSSRVVSAEGDVCHYEFAAQNPAP